MCNTKIRWNIKEIDILDSAIIPEIIQATEVILYPIYSSPIIFTRSSKDTVKIKGSFITESTGQRWGNATYTLNWNTGAVTISEQYANSDWNSKKQ